MTKEQLKTLVEAGKHAANGENAQGWHFTVIMSQRGKDLLLTAAGEAAPEGAPPGLEWPVDLYFHGATIIITVSGDPAFRFPECGYHMAAGNIMNVAVSLGLAGMWSTCFTRISSAMRVAAAYAMSLYPGATRSTRRCS